MSPDLPAASPSFDLLGMDRQIQRGVAGRRALRISAWTGVAAVGVVKGGFLGWLGAGAGIFAIARDFLRWRDERPEWQKKPLPEPRPLRQLLASRHADSVDRASASSFPASDAPSHAGSD